MRVKTIDYLSIFAKNGSMKTDYQVKVILRLRRVREKLGYSQSKVALILGISDGQVGNIETPSMPHKYTLAQIQTLCKNFKIPIESVFFKSEELKGEISIAQMVGRIVLYQTNK